jgi:hypothetical protein
MNCTAAAENVEAVSHFPRRPARPLFTAKSAQIIQGVRIALSMNDFG